jgi:hypothetical protein
MQPPCLHAVKTRCWTNCETCAQVGGVSHSKRSFQQKKVIPGSLRSGGVVVAVTLLSEAELPHRPQFFKLLGTSTKVCKGNLTIESPR